MNSLLKVICKSEIENNLMLENDCYVVHILKDELSSVFKHKAFNYPSIDIKWGINVSATGSLKVTELDDHIKLLQVTTDTLKQTLSILKTMQVLEGEL